MTIHDAFAKSESAGNEAHPNVGRAPLPDRAGEGARPIYIVVGMHRSGTSLLSHILHYLGVEMSDGNLVVSPSNPGGFWERQEIVALHDEILRIIDAPVKDFSHALPLPVGWWRRPEVQAVKAKLRAYVAAELARCPGRWGFKDPRTSRMIPLWKEICDELGLVPRFIWAIRSPGDAGESMALKNPKARPIDQDQGCLLWFIYNIDILRNCGPSVAAVVDYESWFQNPKSVGQDLIKRLDLDWYGPEDELETCLQTFIKPEYRHHDEAGRRSHRLRALYEFYEAIQEFGRSGTLPARLVQQGHSLEAATQIQLLMQAPVRESGELKARMESLTSELAERQGRWEKQEQLLTELQERVSRQKGEIIKVSKERDTALEDCRQIRRDWDAEVDDLKAQLQQQRQQPDALNEVAKALDELSATLSTVNPSPGSAGAQDDVGDQGEAGGEVPDSQGGSQALLRLIADIRGQMLALTQEKAAVDGQLANNIVENQSLQVQLDQVSRQAAQAVSQLEEVTVDRDNLQEALLRAACVQEEQQQQITALRDEHEAQITALRKEHEQQIAAAHGKRKQQIATLREEHEQQLAKLRGEHEQQVAVLHQDREQQLAKLRGQHEQQVAALHQDREQQLASLRGEHEQQIAALHQDREQQLAKLRGEHEQQIAALHQDREQQFAKLRGEHEQQIAALHQDREQQLAKLRGEHEQQIAALHLDRKQQVAKLRGEHEQQIAALHQDREQQLANLRGEHEQQVAALHQDREQQLASLRGEHEQQVAALHQDREQQLASQRGEHEQQIAALHQDREQQLAKLRGEHEQQVAALHQDREQQLAKLRGEHEQQVAALHQDREQQLASQRGEHEQQIAALHQDREQQLASLRGEHEQQIAALHQDREQQLASLRGEHEQQIAALHQDREQQLASLRGEHEQQVAALHQDREQQLASLRGEHEQQVAALHQDREQQLASQRGEHEQQISVLRLEIRQLAAQLADVKALNETLHSTHVALIAQLAEMQERGDRQQADLQGREAQLAAALQEAAEARENAARIGEEASSQRVRINELVGQIEKLDMDTKAERKQLRKRVAELEVAGNANAAVLAERDAALQQSEQAIATLKRDVKTLRRQLETELAAAEKKSAAVIAARDAALQQSEQAIAALKQEAKTLRRQADADAQMIQAQANEITELRLAGDGYLARIEQLRTAAQTGVAAPPATAVAAADAVSLSVPATETTGVDQFDESDYLNRYPDVRQAVTDGLFTSGYQHWTCHGLSEGRHAFHLPKGSTPTVSAAD